MAKFDMYTEAPVDPAERANLLELLLAVANADGQISNDEFNEIRTIADYLLLSSNRVNEAYSKIV
jgi:uncharacterized tellurite resistance protein B-like protein